MLRKIWAAFIFLCLLSGMLLHFDSIEIKADDTVRVLMVGNSLTYSAIYNDNSLNVLKELAETGGHSLELSCVAYDGERLSSYADETSVKGKQVREKIKSNSWDYIIFQEYTDGAICLGYNTGASVRKLADFIRANCQTARILLNCTWAFDGYGSSVNSIDGIEYTYAEQKYNMQVNYETIAADVIADVIYSGKVFDELVQMGINPYQDDGNHPNENGVLANACCIYAKIFGTDPLESNYCGGVNLETAALIKKLAAEQKTYSYLASSPAADGNWYYYIGYEIGVDVSGIACNKWGWWYVENGRVDFTASTIAQNQYGWWVIRNGQVDFTYTGLADNEYGTWYCENGQVDFSKNDIIRETVDGEDGWWYISEGRLQRVDTVAPNRWGWWYVKNGKVDFAANTIAQNQYGWWVIRNGQVDFAYTGLADNEYGTWYCENGQVDFSKNDIIHETVDGEDGWWYISGGRLQRVDTVAPNRWGWWYVENGRVDFTANTIAQNEYGWWVIRNGQVDFTFTGLADNEYGTWYCVEGRAQLEYSGEVEIDGIVMIISNGRLIE